MFPMTQTLQYPASEQHRSTSIALTAAYHVVGFDREPHPKSALAITSGRDSSMPVKRGTPEDVYGVVPQGPRAMARAILLKPQFPEM